MTTFAALYLAHLIADFPLQTNRIYKLKIESSRGILLHVAIHLLVASILIEDALAHWSLFLVLGVTHFLVDWVKVHHHGHRQTPGFLLDQLAHFLTILLLALWQPDLTAVLPLPFLWLGIALIMLPATLVFLWVWATDLIVDLPENQTVKWACRSLLPIAQYIGIVFVLALTLPYLIFLVV